MGPMLLPCAAMCLLRGDSGSYNAMMNVDIIITNGMGLVNPFLFSDEVVVHGAFLTIWVTFIPKIASVDLASLKMLGSILLKIMAISIAV
jgi:hypothetical protein